MSEKAQPAGSVCAAARPGSSVTARARATAARLSDSIRGPRTVACISSPCSRDRGSPGKHSRGQGRCHTKRASFVCRRRRLAGEDRNPGNTLLSGQPQFCRRQPGVASRLGAHIPHRGSSGPCSAAHRYWTLQGWTDAPRRLDAVRCDDGLAQRGNPLEPSWQSVCAPAALERPQKKPAVQHTQRARRTIPAATYSPTHLRTQYHRRWQA